MFYDLVGSTVLSVRLDPDELLEKAEHCTGPEQTQKSGMTSAP
jgi:hypothetical protein